MLVGFGLVAVAFGTYAVARQTSLFAIATVQVTGAPPGVRTEARRAAAPFLGTSLLALDGAELERKLAALPTIVSARYDRAFPHTLRLRLVPEVPTSVLRRGKESWLLSARGRVMARLPRGGGGALPRVWVPHATTVDLGERLADGDGGVPARALALAAHFPARVATASFAHGELLFRLRSGFELRLGEATDVRLKLAIARRALRAVPTGNTYLDVSVPGRPVAGPNPQLSGGG